MNISPQQRLRLAVLIDADNAQASRISNILDEIAKYGVASVKRIYADWTQPQANSWKGLLLDHSLQPIQQFGYTTGKNATDSAMIIDAMDLLYTRNFDGFCIVSSDSDFTRLAARIREEGLLVYGFGEQKTPRPFIRSCDRFTYVEILDDASESSVAEEDNTDREHELLLLFEKAFDSLDNNEEWINLGLFGSLLSQIQPDFDPRNYGFRQLNKLIGNYPDSVEIKRGKGNGYMIRRVKASHARLVEIINCAIETLGEKQGAWINISRVGSALSKIEPNFSPSQYGFNQLSRLLSSLQRDFEVKRHERQYLIRPRARG